MNNWNDFNDAEDQQSFDLIPKNTIAKVRMSIRPGGYNDDNMGWHGGFASKSQSSDAVYLSCEYVILEGPYARRKIWSLIGLHSPKGPEWANMGRSFVKNILQSARGINPKDNSPQANAARCIKDFKELDGIEFVAKIGVEKDQHDEPKNVINIAVTPDHKDYASVMGNISNTATTAPPTPQTPYSNALATNTANPNKPHWAP